MSGRYQRIPPSYVQGRVEGVDSSNSILQSSSFPTIWLGGKDGTLHIYREKDGRGEFLYQLKFQAPISGIIYLGRKIFVALASGECRIFTRSLEGDWDFSNYHAHSMMQVIVKMKSKEKFSFSLGKYPESSVSIASIGCMEASESSIWIGCQNSVYILDSGSLDIIHRFEADSRKEAQVTQLAAVKAGVWCSSQIDSKICLYSAFMPYNQIQSIDIQPQIETLLSSKSFYPVRITALKASSDHLWIGTDTGLVLNFPFIPSKIVPFNALPPTCDSSQIQLSLHSHGRDVKFFVQAKNLMISGGEGYRDLAFDLNSGADGVLDKDCPHLIVWEEKCDKFKIFSFGKN